MRSWLDVPVNTVLVGQLLSLSVSLTGIVSTALAGLGASVPFTQSASNYAVLFIIFGGPARLLKWGWEQEAWKYGLLAAVDVVSTWCVVKAFSLTSITSVTLLDSWTIPCVILLTAVFFKQRYSTRQVLSATLAVSGLAMLLLFDNRSTTGPQPCKDSQPCTGSQAVTLQGDMLVVLGATGYAINNVLSEHILKSGDPAEFLAGLGTFGLVATCIAMPLFEWKQLEGAPWSVEMSLLLAAYAAAMLVFSLCMPVVLHQRGSAFFNLSLLTSDFYAFAARAMLLQGFTRSSLIIYVISSTLVVIGLVLYFTSSLGPPPLGPPATRPARPLHTSAAPQSVSESSRGVHDVICALPTDSPNLLAQKATVQCVGRCVSGGGPPSHYDDGTPVHSVKRDELAGLQAQRETFSGVVDGLADGDMTPKLADELHSCSDGMHEPLGNGFHGMGDKQPNSSVSECDASRHDESATGWVHCAKERDAPALRECDRRSSIERSMNAEEIDGGDQTRLLTQQSMSQR